MASGKYRVLYYLLYYLLYPSTRTYLQPDQHVPHDFNDFRFARLCSVVVVVVVVGGSGRH